MSENPGGPGRGRPMHPESVRVTKAPPRKLALRPYARAVGQVLNQVKANGQEENTLVFFIADNGGPQANGSSNAPLSGYKASVFEGGFRVPLFVKWPAKVAKGIVRDEPVISLDVFPTAAAAAGVKPAGDSMVDGVDQRDCGGAISTARRQVSVAVHAGPVSPRRRWTNAARSCVENS